MDELFLGQGKVYVAKLSAPNEFSYLGDCPSLSVVLGSKNLRYATDTSGGGTLPKVLDDGDGETQIAMSLSHFSRENLASAVYGDSAVSGASTHVTAEAVVARVGKMAALAHLNILTGTPLVLTDGSLTTYTKGPDYLLDTPLGELTFPVGTTIPDGSTTRATYDYGPQETVAAFTSAPTFVWVRYSGVNVADGNAPVVVDFYKVKLFTQGDIPLIGPDFSSMKMSGVVYHNGGAGGLGVGNFFRVRKV